MDETIKTILYSWMDRKFPEIIPREVNLGSYLDMKPRKVLAITGFRRVGKTYLLFQLLNEILKRNDKEQAVYINFDDERIPERTEFLTQLLPIIKQTFSKDPEYIFLDEIQNMPDWSRWLRRIYDSEDMGIFVTGSSSKVSSREIPTELRGRSLEIKVFPLSFGEFLNFRRKEIDIKAVKYSESERTKLVKMLNEFLNFGGMPEVVLAREDKKFEILQQYFGTVVSRDIIERFRVKNEVALKSMLKLLLNSTHYSISRMYDNLKSLNYKIGKTTLLNYMNYVESSYFTHSLPIFSPKVKDQLQYARKVYFIDCGFINALSTRLSKNMGRLYENTVAIELLRRSSKKDVELYYWKDRLGKEVDFVVKEGLKIRQLIQVCYDIDNFDTKKRELDALLKCSYELKCKDLLIITGDSEGIEEYKNRRIKLTPLWKWLLVKQRIQ